MAVSLAQTRRDHSTTGAIKLVPARVTAQTLTLAVLLTMAAIEFKDRKQRMGKFQRIVIMPSDLSSGTKSH